ncbi:carbamoyl-phosphate synthase (glutamine-hydrolyzing) cpa2 [Aspergillus nanangensis]|uniref:Carbamoyl phosphate synthase arginine-specific large chain, mitochondrial n=1 Tax=Aspergillus nanangensis TaxID=2582783 RepID=A0AAD4CI60_ASPNN|nr:carbamoyl-phosphate synthase (glutamine-hydrolyzing) cpa2 [Aspergillus nanangensis]
MVLAARCGQATSSLLRQRCLTRSAAALRPFSSQTIAHSTASTLRLQAKTPSPWRPQQLRSFSSALCRLASEATPPAADSYLASGVVKPGQNLVDVKKVLVIGSGGLSIGQAGEFDYSGSQALKALKEAGVQSVLINPNIATIQTDHKLADEVYYLPVTPEYVTYVIEREQPDGVFLSFGGQTALNLGVQMNRMGTFDRYGVKVLGTSIQTLETSEDRDLFSKALNEINIPIAESIAVNTVDEALKAAEEVGYPIIVRSAYALGGLGSGFANNAEELRDLSSRSLTLSPQILVEKSLRGWKEVEYEVVRDASNNCITVCNMENFDPLGIHTGDSIVVAPSQTLSDEEYHMLRTAAIKIVRHLGVVGECNVQYALQPDGLDYRVIEVNARLSRSSALASKATGYPLAYTAAKIGLGHTLPELPNAVTKTTTANFEPSLDYIVTKIPRWDLSKFQHVDRGIGSAMKSVGEVMAIGRTFEESFQKAIRQVDPSFLGFQGDHFENLDEVLKNPTDRRWLAVGQAMLHENYSVEKVHDLTKIDKWFLYKLQNLVDCNNELKEIGSLFGIQQETMMKAKKLGFSDKQIALLVGATEDDVRARRKSFGIRPWVKKIDTLAAEFPADTNYLYTTYNATSHDVTFDDHGIIILGSGVYRIGSSVEFDWCAVNATLSLRNMGKKTVMINYNPETYSTDFDTADKLYFEELSYERVMDIYELEAASGVVVSVGGQLPQNIALRLQETGGAHVLGTDPKDIDRAEDRHKFSSILDSIGVDQPAWKELTSVADAENFAESVGYPVLVRPSYVLSGAAMNVIYSVDELKEKLLNASAVSPDHPVVITKFIEGAEEIDVDAVASNGKLLLHAVSEHVEPAGIHSGDATLVLPPASLDESVMGRVKEIAEKVAKAWNITGPFNMQIIKADQEGAQPALKVIECNLRASRSFPFVSKVLGTNFIDTATKALVGRDVPEPTDLMTVKRDYLATKVPQFSWTRLAGADPFLGVEMASTGEIACFGKDLVEAYWASLQSTMNFRVPEAGEGILLGGDIKNVALSQIVDYLHPLGFKFFAASPEVKKHIEATSKDNVSVQVIEFPKKDKRALREVFQKYDIRGAFNLAKTRGKTLLDEDYVMRRNAVDFGVPLFMETKTALLFAQAMSQKLPRPEGIPDEVRSWSEFAGRAASVIAVIQITGAITQICGSYISKVKEARQDILRLQEEIDALSQTLKSLEKLLHNQNSTKPGTSQNLVDNVAKCSSTLTRVRDRINPEATQTPMRKWGLRALKWPMKSEETMKFISEIERYKTLFGLSLLVDQTQSTNLLDQKIDLGRLHIAEGAAFNDYKNQHTECLPGTRVELLREIYRWVEAPDSKCIFWLNGMAGTGKSTIARTVASCLKGQSLGASFFFKRGEQDRGNAKLLFSTLARQLGGTVPQLVPGIQKSIKDDPDISRRVLREQFEKLILQPLIAVIQAQIQSYWS